MRHGHTLLGIAFVTVVGGAICLVLDHLRLGAVFVTVGGMALVYDLFILLRRH